MHFTPTPSSRKLLESINRPMAIAGKKNNAISISGVPFEPKKEGRKSYLLSFAENGNYFRRAQV